MKRLLAGMMALTLGGLPVEAIQTDESHRQLWASLTDVGITVLVNPVECFEEPMNGYYMPSSSVLGICQDNIGKPGKEVKWTENDLDTLRHEAQHVIQDCLQGTHGDGRSVVEYGPQVNLMRFVRSVYTEEEIKTISEWYRGVPGDVMLMELEAFAVAETQSAYNLSEKVERTCRS